MSTAWSRDYLSREGMPPKRSVAVAGEASLLDSLPLLSGTTALRVQVWSKENSRVKLLIETKTASGGEGTTHVTRVNTRLWRTVLLPALRLYAAHHRLSLNIAEGQPAHRLEAHG